MMDRNWSHMTVHGRVDCAEADLKQWLGRGDFGAILDCAGHFVIVATDSHHSDVVIISSRSGLIKYFYSPHLSGRQFHHGPSVHSVVTSADLPWGWDYDALADYFALGHPLGARSLNRDVQRVPMGAVLRFSASAQGVEVTSYPDPQRNKQGGGRGAVEQALDALVQTAKRLPDEIDLSMSGGFDSRVLLAALLAAGKRPRLIVSGARSSFDRDISEAIAKGCDLPLEAVVVSQADLLGAANHVALSSDGQLPLSHVAGLVHCQVLARPGVPLLMGFNGEFARSYYTPQPAGKWLHLINRPPAEAVDVLIDRIQPPFLPDEMAAVSQGLAQALSEEAIRSRLKKEIYALNAENAAETLDEFYLSHYGRHKSGADLSFLTSINIDWNVPFFDFKWINSIRNLDFSYKHGDLFHRKAVSILSKKLDRFPYESDLKFSSKKQHIYDQYIDQNIFKIKFTSEEPFIRNADPEFLEKDTLYKIFKSQNDHGLRPHIFFSLFTLLRWRDLTRNAIQ
ncbi:MAG: hypothetical protein P4N41_22585 [Negativicutes bacterium]|nr:hypothetical protein [Negativicutes bacterium]